MVSGSKDKKRKMLRKSTDRYITHCLNTLRKNKPKNIHGIIIRWMRLQKEETEH